MTDEELDAIEARASAAIEGPWRCEYDENVSQVEIRPVNETIVVNGVRMHMDGVYTIIAETGQWSDDEATSPTAEFIAHARTDVPALIAELREMLREVRGK